MNTLKLVHVFPGYTIKVIYLEFTSPALSFVYGKWRTTWLYLECLLSMNLIELLIMELYFKLP